MTKLQYKLWKKLRQWQNTFTKNFFKGDVAKDPKGFDGLDKRIAGTGQEIASKAADNAAILDEMNVLLDTVKGGADVIFMNRQARRKLLSVMQASQHYIENEQDAFGRQVAMYGGVPILVIDDAILPTDGTAKTTDLYAVKFGAHTHVTGLQNGGISVRKLGETSAKAVEVTRIEWFVAMAMFNPFSAARLKGLKVA